MNYAHRLAYICDKRGKLCVGLDPQPSVLQAWGLDQNASGIAKLTMTMIEALGNDVAVFKPQSAFFEAYGSAGIKVLEEVLAAIRDVGAISILDIKRGDIGSTMSGYANAYLNPSSPLCADAITLNPYLGFGSLSPAIELAAKNNRGVYILARTSNPESAPMQLATADLDCSVAQMIVNQAKTSNKEFENLIGLVIGGTHDDIGIELSGFTGSILVPGIGAQGGKISNLTKIFGKEVAHVLPTVSRQILLSGPKISEIQRSADILLSQITKII